MPGPGALQGMRPSSGRWTVDDRDAFSPSAAVAFEEDEAEALAARWTSSSGVSERMLGWIKWRKDLDVGEAAEGASGLAREVRASATNGSNAHNDRLLSVNTWVEEDERVQGTTSIAATTGSDIVDPARERLDGLEGKLLARDHLVLVREGDLECDSRLRGRGRKYDRMELLRERGRR